MKARKQKDTMKGMLNLAKSTNPISAFKRRMAKKIKAERAFIAFERMGEKMSIKEKFKDDPFFHDSVYGYRANK